MSEKYYTPECKKDSYKCPNWGERRDGSGDCMLPKCVAVSECPYLRKIILEKCKENSYE